MQRAAAAKLTNNFAVLYLAEDKHSTQRTLGAVFCVAFAAADLAVTAARDNVAKFDICRILSSATAGAGAVNAEKLRKRR